MRRRKLIFLPLGLAGLPVAARANPIQRPPERWALWEQHDPTSRVHLDHALWGQVLKRLVRGTADGVNLVAYAGATRTDRETLDAYIAELAAISVTKLSRDEQLPYWANLYNALIVRLVLDHYPIATVTDIPPAPGAQGPWSSPLVTIEGQVLTLNDLEHRILRPIWRDPRIHYAISWASLGSPNLLAEPINCDRTGMQLDTAATAFVNHPRALWLEHDALTLSSIYDWFQEDFGGSPRAVIQHMLAYARPELAMRLQKVDRIIGYRYDWQLNGAS